MKATATILCFSLLMALALANPLAAIGETCSQACLQSCDITKQIYSVFGQLLGPFVDTTYNLCTQGCNLVCGIYGGMNGPVAPEMTPLRSFRSLCYNRKSKVKECSTSRRFHFLSWSTASCSSNFDFTMCCKQYQMLLVASKQGISSKEQ